MRRFALAGVMLMAAGLSVSCSNDNSDEVFEAVLAGSNENPARASSGNGRSHVVIHGDTVSYSVEIDDISNVTLSHIHVGPATGNGPVRVNFF
ncbi:MAG: CHRD domain-containing protein, partial [bacterium]